MLWKEIESSAKVADVRTALVLQEEVQKSILTALSRKEVFNKLVFQGGTVLRLFYGNPRFSEDLDFVTTGDKNGTVLLEQKGHIQNFVRDCFPFLDGVDVRVQKDDELKRLILKTLSDVQEQSVRIHMEVFPVTSHESGSMTLNYPPFFPAVRVESVKEILSDKMAALMGCDYVKGRDLWDVYFLVNERDVTLDMELLRRKVDDYVISQENRSKALERCREKGRDALDNELKRFLPTNTYQGYSQRYADILEVSLKLLEDVQGRL